MLEPMLATLAEAPLDDPNLVYEPKYDGIRAIVEVPGGKGPVRLWSRLGNEKTRQFPEIADALARWGARRREAVILDGELVALDEHGQPAGFQRLQGRIHLREVIAARRSSREPDARRSTPSSHQKLSNLSNLSNPSNLSNLSKVAFIAFDLLREGTVDWRDRPLVERRRALERIFSRGRPPVLRLSEQVRGNGREMYARAREAGWEGLIVKHADSRYRSGRRSRDWRKLKIVHEQEFVIGGWTEPRNSRAHFGALLLGVYSDAAGPTGPARGLTYVGHVGTGFDERELTRVMARLEPIETTSCPFAVRPTTNEVPHWAQPKLVAQVKFSEWTADGILRHPVYLGLRDDKRPEDIRREDRRVEPRATTTSATTADNGPLIEQLRAIEASRHDGSIDLPGGGRLAVTNLHKIFWPRQRITKGDLFRYYVEVAPFVLPAIADRPLVMKRFPNGIAHKPFYQHRVGDAPEGVRVETVGAAGRREQLIGGDLLTLLYTTQLATISQDPWFSRVGSLEFVDYIALDLDPAPGVSFSRVLDVARWIRDQLAVFGGTGFAKTSGADGLHVYVPMPPETSYDTGLLFAQIVATLVAERHPNVATVERFVRARGKRVYVDYLQNVLGKTLASAYSARASDYAGVSTPLTWKEIDGGVEREDFTIRSVPGRLRSVGDLWAPRARARGVDLARIVGKR